MADRGRLFPGLHWPQKFSAETGQHLGRVQIFKHNAGAVWLTDDVERFSQI
jgi:hypothetical protein